MVLSRTRSKGFRCRSLRIFRANNLQTTWLRVCCLSSSAGCYSWKFDGLVEAAARLEFEPSCFRAGIDNINSGPGSGLNLLGDFGPVGPGAGLVNNPAVVPSLGSQLVQGGYGNQTTGNIGQGGYSKKQKGRGGGGRFQRGERLTGGGRRQKGGGFLGELTLLLLMLHIKWHVMLLCLLKMI